MIFNVKLIATQFLTKYLVCSSYLGVSIKSKKKRGTISKAKRLSVVNDGSSGARSA